MKFRLLLILALACAVASCNTPKKKKNENQRPPSMADVSGDVSFQSVLNMLRKAVAKHDVAMVASLMTPDFGYLMDPIPGDSGSGEGVFRVWDKNNLWPELNLIIREKFVPFGNYMVAPPEFTTDPSYTGYRAGIMNSNGTWKFAYFVTGTQAQQ